MRIAAIPTIYTGIRFRSRLEAKWAMFFDYLQWPWLYEPIDLDGYIPDFIINLHDEILVEVKPGTTTEDLGYATHKIDKSWKRQAIVVGAAVPLPGCDQSNSDSYPCIGIFNEQGEFGLDGWLECVLFRCGKCQRLSPASIEGSYRCRVCSAWDGDHLFNPAEVNDIKLVWANACNKTQWKGGR